MKTVKIKFVGCTPGLDPTQLLLYHILHKYYDVQICDDPDYIICSCFGKPYEYCKYPAVRIMNIGENYLPDFNLVDYAVCLYPMHLLDRCFYMPICTDAYDRTIDLENKTRIYTEDFLQNKQYFANLITGHESEYGIRGSFFEKLSIYKRVEAPGNFLNNMENGMTVNWGDNSKTDFQRKCKFSICFESTKNEGFITEKIVDAFSSDSIPIYYGSSTVSDIFNPKAFINCNDFSSFEEVIEYIKYVDTHDDVYLSIMNQPILNDSHFFSNKRKEFEAFVRHIFDQPIEEAYRRSRVYSAKAHEDFLLSAIDSTKELNENDIRRLSTRKILKILAARIKEKCFKHL